MSWPEVVSTRRSTVLSLPISKDSLLKVFIDQARVSNFEGDRIFFELLFSIFALQFFCGDLVSFFYRKKEILETTLSFAFL